MKNYIAIAALLAAGSAFANAAYTVTTDNSYYTNPNAWVYVWKDGVASGNWETGTNWEHYKDVSDVDPDIVMDNKPVNADPAFIGYDFSFVDGKQVLTATADEITVTTPTWMGGSGRVFLGSNVTLLGGSNGFFGGQAITFNFGDFSGSSIISMGDFWMQTNARVNFAGEIQMTASTFSYDVFCATNMAQNAGVWNASEVSVKDANGNVLVYTADEVNFGKAGYYWLESTYKGEGTKNVVSIKAVALPEPSTFGLLAGLGALALVGTRRRRK